jgi:hypothetical protein
MKKLMMMTEFAQRLMLNKNNNNNNNNATTTTATNGNLDSTNADLINTTKLSDKNNKDSSDNEILESDITNVASGDKQQPLSNGNLCESDYKNISFFQKAGAKTEIFLNRMFQRYIKKSYIHH